MNYITEINGFEQWTEHNNLSSLAQLLWYKLVALDNRCGWIEWVTVDNLRLMAFIKCNSKNTFLRARDQLVDCGLIEYKKGKKGQPNKYRIISFSSKSEPQMEPQMGPQMEPQMGLQMGLQMGHINKLNNIYLSLYNKYKGARPNSKDFFKLLKYESEIRKDPDFNKLNKIEQLNLISELNFGGVINNV